MRLNQPNIQKARTFKGYLGRVGQRYFRIFRWEQKSWRIEGVAGWFSTLAEVQQWLAFEEKKSNAAIESQKASKIA